MEFTVGWRAARCPGHVAAEQVWIVFNSCYEAFVLSGLFTKHGGWHHGQSFLLRQAQQIVVIKVLWFALMQLCKPKPGYHVLLREQRLCLGDPFQQAVVLQVFFFFFGLIVLWWISKLYIGQYNLRCSSRLSYSLSENCTVRSISGKIGSYLECLNEPWV